MYAREQLVEQSVQDFVKDQLFDQRGYTTEQVGVLDSFPDKERRAQPLDKTYVAMGFHFDEGGVQAELGSDLKTRVYVIEFFVFGKDSTWANNIGPIVRDAVDYDGTIPLLDISQEDKPEIDRLLVITVAGRKEQVESPMPWEENVYSVTAHVQDDYYARLV